jgi:hypothetical protein
LHAASTSYSADLRPDARLRRLVLLTGGLLFLGGLVLLPLVAVSLPLKGLLALSWTVLCGFEWLALRQGYAGSGLLRIAAGGHIERRTPDGAWQPARLCAGSLVLARIAWLRIAAPGVRPYAELVSAGTHASEDWRRLRVIWRHIGAA